MRKKPPSRVRYERSHPVVSARLDKETYEKLREMLRTEGKSLAGFLKDFVKRRKEGWDGAYQKEHIRKVMKMERRNIKYGTIAVYVGKNNYAPR